MNRKFLETDYPQGIAKKVFRLFHFVQKGQNPKFYILPHLELQKSNSDLPKGEVYSETPRRVNQGNISLVFTLCLLSILLFVSCDSSIVQSDYRATTDGKWDKDTVLEFKLSELDTVTPYHLFINLRNDETYEFSNLFLIAELNYPDGASIKDTLEYEMTKPNGEWLGKGAGSIKENKLWYKENIVFPVKGVYTLKIGHAMRKNGTVKGIIDLEGITDVGYQIEKTN
jgi:gliding motility-associated lipoprotein GldH